MTLPTNAKGRPFSWSLSALQDFEGCPFRYAASKFYCTVAFVETEAIIWGNRVHDASERFIKKEKCTDQEALKVVEPYVAPMMLSGLPIEAEKAIVLDANMKPIKGAKAWFSGDAWLRAKIDVIMTAGSKALVYDHKTGKIKEDDDQMLLYFAALDAFGCQFKEYEGRYIWLKYKQVSNPVCKSVEDIPSIWARFLPRVERMARAWREEDFPQKPSPLCPYCQVMNCAKRR